MTCYPPLRGFLSIFAFGVAISAHPGGALALTASEIANLDGPDREKVLMEGAKKEDGMLWYTTLQVDEASRPLTDAFIKKYPSIKAELYRGNSTTIIQRLFAERDAKKINVDVIVFNASDANGLVKAGLAEPFRSPVQKEYPAGYIPENHAYSPVRVSQQGVAYNTTVIPKGQEPKTWDDLLDPKWKGKMAWAESTGTGAPFLISYFRTIWGDDKTMDYLKKLKAQDIRLGGANSQSILDNVVTGEYTLGVSITLTDIAVTQAKGAPVSGFAPEPVMSSTSTAQLIKGAPHPYSAMLFIDFLLSKDGGQKVLRDGAYLPAHPAVDPLPEMAWTLPRTSGKKEIVEDPARTLELAPKSFEIFTQLFKQ
jgi:ABC-type Fe3+ transport system substrate-binding protein